jgi:ribonuclease HI
MEIYTDGACSGNGYENSKGGFGVVVVKDNKYFEAYQKLNITGTTNNEMELKAILYALIKYGKQRPIPTVYSDSAYSVQTLTNWMYGWANRGWLKSDNKPPENLELIKAFYHLNEEGYRINLQKIKGHAGAQWNEEADRLATGKVSPEDLENKYNGRKIRFNGTDE